MHTDCNNILLVYNAQIEINICIRVSIDMCFILDYTYMYTLCTHT